jgi:hypothetical protein
MFMAVRMHNEWRLAPLIYIKLPRWERSRLPGRLFCQACIKPTWEAKTRLSNTQIWAEGVRTVVRPVLTAVRSQLRLFVFGCSTRSQAGKTVYALGGNR